MSTRPTVAALARQPALMAAGLFALAVALYATALLPAPFDGLYGQDAYAYYDYAAGPLRAALAAGQPWPPTFWPPGYPLLIVAAGLLAGHAPTVAQWVSLLCGAAVPAFTYLLARELWPLLWPEAEARHWALTGPLLAGLIVALNPQLWQSSIVVMADAPGLAAATLGGWALARYGRTGRGCWLVLSGSALAYAILTRWAFALAAIPLAAAGIWALVKQARVRPSAAVGPAAVTALAGGVVLLPILLSLLGPSPAAGEARAFAGNLEVYSWSPVNFVRRSFVTADGAQTYRLPNGVYYGLLPAHPAYFTPLLALFLLPGAWHLFHARRSAVLWALLAGWPLMILLFHAGAPWQNFRFGLAALPPLAILLAAGVITVARWRGGQLRWVVAVVSVIGTAWLIWSGWGLTRSFIERKQADLARVAAVEAQTAPNARLITFQLTSTFTHYSRLDTYELWGLTAADLTRLTSEPGPLYLLVDVPNVEAQWTSRSPALNYQWLRDGPGLEPLGQFDDYQLFAVRCACP